jgi:hypothetical protein
MGTSATIEQSAGCEPGALSAADGQTSPPGFCPKASCSSCDLDGRLNCHQGAGDIADFMIPAAMYFIPFIGGMVVMKQWEALIVWGALAAVFFSYFQQKLVCCRCPHYAGRGFFLSCHAAFGLPKIPKYNPRPLGRAGWLFLMAWLAILFLYPFPFLVLARQWLLLAITGGALFSWVWFVGRRLCVRCVNVFCPFNRLPQAARNGLKAAWEGRPGRTEEL